jgi:hypothetical protein
MYAQCNNMIIKKNKDVAKIEVIHTYIPAKESGAARARETRKESLLNLWSEPC